MSLRHAGIRAPGPGSLVDPQHPLGHGCVGCWWPNAAIDAGRGLSIPDLSPAAMHATLTAGTSWGLGYDGLSWGYKATTTSHYGTVPYSPAQDVQTGLFSVMAIVQPSGTDDYYYFTKTIAAGNDYTWALAQLSSAFYFILYNRPVLCTANVFGLTVGVTYLLVGVLDVSKCYLWVKNLSTGVMTRGSGDVLTLSASTKQIYIGRRGGSTEGVFQGVGSGYAVWNRALSEQDVITLCNEPAAMIWEPGRKRTFLFGTLAGLTAELADTATGADSIAALLACTATLADDGTGADSLAAKAAFAAALVDTATGSDDLSATAALLVSLADTATGADTLEALYAATVLLADDGTGADTLDALRTILVELSDAAGGSDALSASLAAIATLGDTATGADTLGAVAAYLATLADAAEGSDALSVLAAVAGIRHVLTIRDKRKVTTIRDLREALTIRDKRDVTTLK